MRVIGLLLLACSAFAQTAVFPGAIVGDSQLATAINRIQTTSTWGIGTADTSFTVANADGIVVNSIVSIDNERMWVCDVNYVTISVGKSSCPNIDGRGFDGSTAAAHRAGAAAYFYIDAWHHNATKAEIIALETKLHYENISVKDFGATGNGTTDDTVAIQAAVTAICATGGKLYFPSGTYKISATSHGIVGTINACNNVEIYGNGDATVFPVAVNTNFTSADPAKMPDGGLFQFIGATNLYFHDFYVRGSQTILDGVYQSGQRVIAVVSSPTVQASNIIIERIHSYGMASENLYVAGEFGTKPNNVRILNNHVDTARFSGIQLNYSGTGGPPYTNGVNSVVSGNIVEHAGNYCLEGPFVQTSVTNNHLFDCRVYGISDSSNGTYTNNNIISGNDIHGDNAYGAHGILVAGQGSSIIGNDITGMGGSGIFITQSSGLQGTNNTIVGNKLHGNGTYSGACACDIRFSSGTDNTIAHNTFWVEGATTTGILVTNPTNAYISGNRFTGYTTNIDDSGNKALKWGNEGGTTFNIVNPMWTSRRMFLTPLGGSQPTDYQGFIQGIGAGSQIRLNATDVDGGLYLMGAAPSQAYIAAGSYFGGSVHTAKSATTSGLTLFDGVGVGVANTGLTPGSLYTPTEVWRWDNTGIRLNTGITLRDIAGVTAVFGGSALTTAGAIPYVDTTTGYLTQSGTLLKWDTANSRLCVNCSSASSTLHIANGSAATVMNIRSTGNVYAGITMVNSGTTWAAGIGAFNGNGTNFQLANGSVKALDISPTGVMTLPAVHFASLPTTNGSIVYCDDCTIANPCAGSGTGAFAKRLNGVSVCN